MTWDDRPTWLWPDRARSGRFWLFVLTAGCYIVGSLPARFLLSETGLAAVFFIPAGVSVAFLLRVPRRHWWVVLGAVGLAEFLMDYPVGYDTAAIAGFVAGNVIEPLIGAAIVVRWCGPVDLARLRHVAFFIVGPVIIATAVGAAIGSFPISLVGDADFWVIFPQWWLGDALGVVLVGGTILAFGSSPDQRSLLSWPGIALLAGSALLSVPAIRTGLPITFLVLIGIVMAGSLFGVRAAAMTGVVVAITFAVEFAFGSGFLIAAIPNEVAFQIIKLRLLVFTLAGLIVAAEAHEGRTASRESAMASARAEQALAERHLEREIAVRLQAALLPGRPASRPELPVAARYEAGSETLLVGGDWYDVHLLAGARIGVTVGDVVGHGVEAAAMMGRMRTAVSVLALSAGGPAELLRRLSEFAGGPDGPEFATASYTVIDPDSGILRYASAGHPPMILLKPDGSVTWLDRGRSQPLHAGAATVSRPEAVFAMQDGDLLIAYTDGLIERRGEDLSIGLARLEEAVMSLAGRSPDDVCDLLMDRMGVSEERADDVVVVTLGYVPSNRQAQATVPAAPPPPASP